jgi:Ribbon-helix-helix protein, copG family
MTNNLRTVVPEGTNKVNLTPSQRKELDRILTAIAKDLGTSKSELIKEAASKVR